MYLARAVCLLFILLIGSVFPAVAQESERPVKLGVIFSDTGTMTSSERPLLAATRAAVAEINASGGVLGRPIELIIRDSESDPDLAARQAEDLITKDGINVLFGCWTSACRKAVVRVVEKHSAVFFYPVQYEGRGTGELPADPHPRVIYSGSAPNQQIGPAVYWALNQVEKPRIFLVGSDYVFPRSANRFIRQLLSSIGGEVVGEHYQPLGAANFEDLRRQLESAKPNVILNTVNGLDNADLFALLSELDPTADRYKVISFSVEENQIREIGAGRFVGRYAAWNYFHDEQRMRDSEFLKRFRELSARQTIETSDPVEAAYIQMWIFAQAARRAGSVAPDDILEASRGLVIRGLDQSVRVDPANRHLWKALEIRRFGSNSAFEPVWRSGYPIAPEPVFEEQSATSSLLMVPEIGSSAEAASALSETLLERRIRALQFFAENPRMEAPGDALARIAAAPASWAEEAMLVRALARQNTKATSEIIISMLGEPGKRDRIHLVLTELDIFPEPLSSFPQVKGAIFDVLSETRDPPINNTAFELLASAEARGTILTADEVARVLFLSGDARDPSSLIGALKILSVSDAVNPEVVSQLDLIWQRLRNSELPGSAAAFCAGLSRTGEMLLADRASSGAREFINLAQRPQNGIAVVCPAAMSSASVLRERLFARQINKFVPKTATDWIAVLGILSFAGMLLAKAILWIVATIAPAWSIRVLRPFEEKKAFWLPNSYQIANRINLSRQAARSDHALRAWVRANREAIPPDPYGRPEPYQPLLSRVRQNGQEHDAIANSNFFEEMTRAGLRSFRIIGEGGVGKTSLARAFLTSLGADNRRDQERIGVFLPARDVRNLNDLGSIISAVQEQVSAQLRRARGLGPTELTEMDDEAFVRCLLSRRKLVVIIDDLPRYVETGWTLLNDPDARTTLSLIGYTGRLDVGGAELEIRPQPLDQTNLLNFVDTYLASIGTGLSLSEKADLSEGIEAVFSSRSTVPTLFARLLVNAVVDARRKGLRLEQRQLAMADLILEYIAATVSELDTEHRDVLDADEWWRALGAIAWEGIGRSAKVTPISRPKALQALSEFEDPDAALSAISKSPMTHRTRDDRISIASDAIAEYLAAMWIFDARAPGRWAATKDEVATRLSLNTDDEAARPTTVTFLAAMLDVCERFADFSTSTRQPIVAPASALSTVQTWIGSVSSPQGTILVGVLHSLTGSMAISETPVVAAVNLAIERINARGGIAGRKILARILDGQSDPAVFAHCTHQLRDEGIEIIFGCWTSASRIAVEEVLQQRGGLLFYPVQYEGYEQSPNVLYFGASPNQQLIPAVDWCVQSRRARRFMLIGSDYVFPRIANEILCRQILQYADDGAQVVGQPFYVPLSGWDFGGVFEAIARDKPDIILNTLNGEANLEFFWGLWKLRKENADLTDMRVMSFSLSDHEAQRIGAELLVGHFAAWTYFASLDRPQNEVFLRAMRASKSVFFPSDPAEAAYVQLMMFGKAAESLSERGASITASTMREEIFLTEFEAPSGRVSVDASNGHAHKIPRIGEFSREGIFEVIWESPSIVAPQPYPFLDLIETAQQLRKLTN